MPHIRLLSHVQRTHFLLYATLLAGCLCAPVSANLAPQPTTKTPNTPTVTQRVSEVITLANQSKLPVLPVLQPCKKTGCIFLNNDQCNCNFGFCVIKTNGKLGCWDKETGAINAIPPSWDKGVAFVTLWGRCVCAVKSNGKFGCWGDDFGGGNCYLYLRHVLTYANLTQSEGLVSLSVTSGCACGVTVNGLLVCETGRPDSGSGLDKYPDGFTSGLVSVVCSSNHACALKSDGRLACWGGDSSSNLITIPRGFTTAIESVVAGPEHTCAIKKGGKLACWGFLGVPPITIPQSWDSDIASVALGQYSTTCAVKKDGRARCWGKDYCDFCNIGQFSKTLPADFSSGIASIAHTGLSGCAVKNSSSQVACWGDSMEVPDDAEFLKGVVCSRNCVSNQCTADSKCSSKCATGYYKADNGTCADCAVQHDGSCWACTATSCTSCVAGYFLSAGQCVACSEGCARCSNTTFCDACLPGYQKSYESKGATCEVAEWCQEGSYPFSCTGPGCNLRSRFTNGRTEGCMKKRDCVLNYQACLQEQPDCRDCCLGIEDKNGKTWYLMRFKDNTLMNCDPPWINSRRPPAPCSG